MARIVPVRNDGLWHQLNLPPTLKGAKPSELPVQAPNKYELVINLKTAKTLGLSSLLPRRLEVRRRDVPVRPAFPGNGAQVLPQLFHGRPAEEPVAVVDFVNDKTGLKHDHVRDHGIVGGVGVFGDVEILLNHAARVGEERPMGAHAAAVFVGLGDIVGADRDQPAIADLDLAMQYVVARLTAAARPERRLRFRFAVEAKI
jgi:hypothetical protein